MPVSPALRRPRVASLLLSAALVVALSPALSPAAAAPLEPVDLLALENLTLPALEGPRTVGGELTVNPGTWNPADVSFSYEWSVGDACCSGGPLETTGPTHVITPGDSYLGFVNVRVTVSKDGYEPVFLYLGTDRIIADVPPTPVASAAGLTAANRGALTVTTEGTVATISIPGTGPGIQFYAYGYSAPTPLGFHVTIDPEVPEFQPSYDIEVDYSALGDGAQRLAVVTLSGALVGWVWVDDEPLSPPVPDSSGLTAGNDGGADETPTGTPNESLIDVPGAEPGDSVFLTAFSTPTPLGWYTVDGNRQIRVSYSSLPVGGHQIAISAADGTLLGWVPVTVVAQSLALTGAVLSPVVSVGTAALAVLGILLLAVARRRARTE